MAPLNKKSVIRVLHVDDELCLLEISKQILTMENNFEIEDVTSVDEAFQKMEQQSYDAIVSDYELPQKNGLDFLKKLREQKNDIPFILFTGKGREDVVVKALNLGADSCINKNGSPETVYCELADAINKTVEHKKSRKLLVASESKYRMLVEKSLQGILVTKTAPLKLVFANEAMGQILGYSPQELLSLSPEGILGLVHHECRAVFFKRMENRLRGETAEGCFEFRAVRKDGSIIWLSALSNRVDYDDQPSVLGMFLDVSESRKAGEILAESEERYRELANCLPDIVFETDINGQVVFANEGAPKLSGYSHGELLAGLNILQFLVPEDRERALKSIQRLLAGGSYVPTEYTFVRKDGTTFPALVIATPRFFKNKMVGLRGLAIDITERKNKEFELQQERDKLETVTENIGAGLFLVDKDYKILWTNKMSKDHFGELESKQCYLAFRNLNDVCPDCGVREIFENGKEIDVREHCFKDTKGDPGWLELTARPVKDGTGKVVAALELAVPITERKKAEEIRKVLENKVKQYSEHLKYMVDLRTAQLKDANERLVKSERLAAIGELAGMIGHDLRNPLAGIRNAVYLLKKKGTTISEAQAKEMFETIDKAIDHSNKIISDLLDYSREMNLKLIKYAARPLVDEAVGMIQVPDRIQIVNHVDEEVCIWVDAGKMLRVFVNLIQNAIDAMPENGRLEITSCQRSDLVEIAFADTGKGIPAEVLPKLFTPLFTTKAQGMGFGLAICKRIIEVQGGTITVETAKNKGTKFTINLPAKLS